MSYVGQSVALVMAGSLATSIGAVASWIGDNLTELALLITGGWAIYSFRRARRSSAARWAVEQFKVFYTDPHLLMARRLIEHEYDEMLAPILQRRVTNRELAVPPDSIEGKAHVDYLLNFLEQLIYLERQGELTSRDRDTFFSYWLSLLNEPRYGLLRRYVCRRGFELLAGTISSDTVHADHKDHEHVGVYGTLMRDSPRQEQLGIKDHLRFFGTTTTTGRMVEFATAPGLDANGGREYAVEIFCVDTQHESFVFAVLDALEQYEPGNEAASRYLRRSRWDATHKLDYWIYVIAERNITADAAVITDSSWPDFVRRTGKAVPEVPPGVRNFSPALLQRMAATSALARSVLAEHDAATDR